MRLHRHRWSRWEPMRNAITVKRTCSRCPAFQCMGIWMLTEKQLLRGH